LNSDQGILAGNGSTIAGERIMRFLALVAVGSVALAGAGCTLVGAGTGALAGVTVNHFADPSSSRRVPVAVPTLVGAAIGLVIDILIIDAISSSESPHFGYPPSNDARGFGIGGAR
jgi:hypothetical protein